MTIFLCVFLCARRRVAVRPVARGAPGPPGAHAGAERPGHVCSHPHQHAVAHQEGGKRHRCECDGGGDQSPLHCTSLLYS